MGEEEKEDKMLHGKKIVVVLPAYNAERTIERTYSEIPKDIVDEIILVDDYSSDKTIDIARKLGLTVLVHDENRGYGANQKTCYANALKRGADIIVMLHPDYQYPPKLITAMAGLIASGMFDVVLGSRILGGYALKGGMPFYKYILNRLLTLIQNLLTRQKLSEYHTGYRVFSREVLLTIPFLENSDDFIFDNQMLMQIFYFGFRIGEITAPCSYNSESSSINFKRSVVYGFGVILNTIKYLVQKHGLIQYRIFDKSFSMRHREGKVK
jgi:glycosyltransferase involved in cell wall biosynthesis